MFSNMISFSCEHLSELLDLFGSPSDHESRHILIIDCRSFMAHNDSHIINSINVFCPPFLRRRNGTKPLLKTLIGDTSIRDRILSDYYFHIILYEELDFTKDSVGYYVARCLQEEAGVKFIKYLEGGFGVFRKQYPLLCTNSAPSPVYIPTIMNKPKRSNSQYIYTWPFRSKTTSPYKPLTPKNTIILEDLSTFVFEDQPEPAELLPYLFLGSECHASSKSILTKLGITAVLNVSQSCPNYFEDLFDYKRIPIKDSKCEDITILIQEALDFIDDMKNGTNGKVLVHCQAGISRSATICIAYLIRTKRIRMEEAYEFVKSRRRLISPNFNFMTQLLEFEDQVFAS